MRVKRWIPCLTLALLVSLPAASVAGVVIFDSAGQTLSMVVQTTSEPSARPEGTDATTIDLWCCGLDPLDWSVNDSFYWATAFDTNDIGETYKVTEVRWFADGGETEQYWIAPNGAGGLPDTSLAVFLGGQTVPASGFQWQSFDASGAGAMVEPGEIYWFIRATDPLGGGGFNMTWRSTTNPAPPVQDPVAISQNFNSGWAKWVTGLNWHMEYEILGDPAGGGGGFPKCVPFGGFCDGLQINDVAGGVLSVTWRNYDCLGSTCECVGKVKPGVVPDACPGGNGNAAIRCRAADGCPGDFYWTIDSLDGTWDMQSGLPFGGTCWIDELSCVVQDGACPFTPGGGGLPSFTSRW